MNWNFWRRKVETQTMETTGTGSMTLAEKNAASLSNQIAALQTKHRELEENRLAKIQASNSGIKRRNQLVAQLVTAGEKAAIGLHVQIDELDNEIKTAQRLAESFEAAATKAGEEIAALGELLRGANARVEQEVRSRKFDAAKANLERLAQAAIANGDAYVASLGTLFREFQLAGMDGDIGDLIAPIISEHLEALTRSQFRGGRNWTLVTAPDWRTEIRPMLPPGLKP